MRKLIILQGVPGSGKSTIAKNWQAEDQGGRVIVSKDALRLGRGVYWIIGQEDYIKKVELYAITSALDYGYDVMVDGTNFSYDNIDYYLSGARGKYTEVETWLIHAPERDCIKRDQNKGRDHSVGPVVVKNFYKKYLTWCEDHSIEPATSGITKTKIA